MDANYVAINGRNAKTGGFPQWRFWVQPQTIGNRSLPHSPKHIPLN